jgi:hypothetical protein
MWRWGEDMIEREFGCGASETARTVANGLGWNLWDERLTQEIARLTESTPEAVEQREWRSDPSVYRIFQDFLRGGFEGGLPPTGCICWMRVGAPPFQKWR